MNRELVVVPMATLKFFKYKENGLTCYEFDATECSPPEPMVNTMHGLNMLRDKNDRLVGMFFHEPTPLYTKLGTRFSYEATELESGDFKIVFKLAE